MSLPHNLFATAFREQRLGLLFGAIMSIMVYLATLAMAAQATLSTATIGWGQQLQNRLTIEIPASDDNTRSQKIIAALKTMPIVIEIEPLSDATTNQLLQPWLKDQDLIKSLPLPTLIDIQLSPDTKVDAEALQQKLTAIVSDVRVDPHAEWLAQLLKLMNSLGLVAWLMIALTGITLIIAISLICRAAMAVQHETIELLHYMGANDSDIASLFQRHARKLSWPAAMIGFGFAVVTIIILGLLLMHFLTQPIRFNTSWLVFGGVLALVPMAAVMGALITARVSVLRLLRCLS